MLYESFEVDNESFSGEAYKYLPTYQWLNHVSCIASSNELYLV
jgi:hypothetical protein